MLRFCTFLLWLLMLALPMQGFASASMQYCGKSVDHMAMQTPVASEAHHHADAANDGHDHAVHLKAAQTAGPEQTLDSINQLPDAAHKCGVCASCCNLVGMTPSVQTVAVHSPPNAAYIEHSILIRSVPLVLPKKPPRA